jgi:tetratricopeptide (TPR) repeat protein
LVKTEKGSKPDSYEKTRLAVILEWLADLARRAGHAEDAVRFGRESVDLRVKRLDVLKDADSRNKLAFGYLWLANALDRVGKSDEAIRCGDRQIELLVLIRKERNDQESRDLLVKALRAQGTRLLSSRNLPDARKRYDDARKEAEAMVAAAPKGSERVPALRLAEALASVAAVDREAGDYDAALKSVDGAIAQYEQAINKASSADARESLASACEEKAALLLRLGRFADAQASSIKGLGLREKADSGKSRQAKAALARAHGQLARLQLLSGDAAAADAAYAQSLKLERELASPAASPGKEDFESRRLLAQSIESLALGSIACGKVADARKTYEQAVQFRKQLSDDDPADALAKAACQATAAGAAALELMAGDSEKAKQFSQQALALATELVKLDPQDSGNQRSLGLALEQFGRIAARQERFSEADNYLSQAIAVTGKLAAQQPARAADREVLARQQKWQAVCRAGIASQIASQTASQTAPPRPAEIQRAWDLFEAEQLSLDSKEEDASKRFEALRAKSAGDAEGLFDVARAAARCAWDATFGDNVDALTPARQKAVVRFCQQAVQTLAESLKAGFKAAEKFADPELDIIRRTPGYPAFTPTGR